jgi:hypothetical protein
MTKLFKQSGPTAQIVVFFAFLIVGCLGALGLLSTSAYVKGLIKPPAVFLTATFTASPQPPSPTATWTPSPEVFHTLTPLPAQWTNTPTPLPELATDIPTLTPVQRTVAPTIDLRTPTITQEPLGDTPTPEADSELRQVQLKYIAFQTAYRTFKNLHAQFDADHSLMLNEKWKAAMLVALSDLEQSAIRLAAVKLTNINYAAYASYLDRLATETGFMASAYRKGLDQRDLVSIQVVAIHLQKMNRSILRAEQEYKEVKSRLATPALTLVASLTPTP